MVNRKSLSVLLALILVLSTVSPVFGVPVDGLPMGGASVTTNHSDKISYFEEDEIIRVIVELEREPILDRAIRQGVSYQGLSLNEVQEAQSIILNEQDIVKNEILSINDEATFRHTYVRAFNGFSVEVYRSEIKDIEALENVKAVYPVERFSLPEPQMNNSGEIINVSDAWDVGYLGAGLLVAVLDTGIDYEHPDFALTNDASGKLTLAGLQALLDSEEFFAEAFAADAQTPFTLTASDLYKSAKVPFAFDYADRDTNAKPDVKNKPDASEHGVHVSGTVAANGAIKGVAPEAQIAAMKVFSDDSPYAYTDDIVAGIEDSILIGADVINMSLGSTSGFTNDEQPDQAAIKKAKEAGIIVAVSAGNSARFGAGSGSPLDMTYTWNPDTGLVGSPSAGTGTFSVASIENTHSSMSAFVTGDGLTVPYQGTSGPDPLDVFTTAVDYVFVGLGYEEDFEGVDVEGKIALISRGEFAFTDKILNAQTNGAVGVIVFNNQGNSFISMMYPDTGVIPAVFVGQAHGEAMAAGSQKTVEFDPSSVVVTPSATAGQMSSFTSWGPTPSLDFKPEITAPGGNIYSTMNDGRYSSMSGTSMAAPHIAGASALMLEYIRAEFPGFVGHPAVQAKFAKNLMMSTAVPVVSPNGVTYSPRRQGAGLLDLNAAVKTDVYVYETLTEESKVALKEVGPVFTFDITVDNFGDVQREFVVSANAQTDGVYSSNYAMYNTGNPVDLSAAVITVSGSGIQPARTTSANIYEVDLSYTVQNININNAHKRVTTSENPIVIVTLPANAIATLTVTVDLTNVAPDGEYGYFFNGFFAEGFVRFLSVLETETNPDLNIPYMGFVGDWSEPPVFDDDLYSGSNWSFYEPIVHSMVSIFDLGGGNYDGTFLGRNNVTGQASYQNIAISPNGDGFKDDAALVFSLIRNAKAMNVSIEDADQNLLEFISLNEVHHLRKPFLSGGQFMYYSFPTPSNSLSSLIWDGTIDGEVAEEGQYFYVVDVLVDGTVKTQTYKYPVFVDVTAPVITSYNLLNTTLTVTATDNHAIMMYAILDADDNFLRTSATSTIDVTGISLHNSKLLVADYAGNETVVNYVPSQPSQGVTPSEPTQPTQPVAPTQPTTPEEPAETVVPVVVNTTAEEVEVNVDSAKLIEAANTSNTVVLEVPASVSLSKPVEVKLPAAAMKELATGNTNIVVKVGEVSFTLNSKFAEVEGDVTILMSQNNDVEYASESGLTPIGMAYNFDILADGKKVEGFSVKPVIQVALDGKSQNPENVGVYVQEADGSWTFIMTYYNEEDDAVYFKAPHFSVYAFMEYTKTFEDIKTHWAKAHIEAMASKRITAGVTETLFAPDRTITRAEFAVMLLNALGEYENGKGTFNDVASGKWYAGRLALAKDLGIIEADKLGNFRPDENLTRQEMAAMVSKAHAILRNIDLTDYTPSVTFTDASSIDAEYSAFVSYAQKNEIIVGFNNEFKPLDLSSRAQALTVIRQMLKK